MIGPPAKQMAFRWRANDGHTFNAGLDFQYIWTTIGKKPYIFVIFQGGGGLDPLPPPPLLWIRACDSGPRSNTGWIAVA